MFLSEAEVESSNDFKKSKTFEDETVRYRRKSFGKTQQEQKERLNHF